MDEATRRGEPVPTEPERAGRVGDDPKDAAARDLSKDIVTVYVVVIDRIYGWFGGT